MRRLLASGLASACALVLAAAPPAVASRGQLATFEAPRELIDGKPATRAAALDELQSLGVTALRMTVFWTNVAPRPEARRRPRFDQTSPAGYRWGGYGALADATKARGLKLLISLSGPVPRWATATGRDHVSDPIAADFKQFAQAAGRRFAGEAMAFSIWNEPNLEKFLSPQFGPHGSLPGAVLYRSLFFAGRHGLLAAGVRVPVLAGELEPVGNAIAAAPLRFLRAVLCLDDRYRATKRCAVLPAEGIAIHPYARPTFPTTAPPGPDDATIGGLGRLVAVIDRAARAGRLRAHLPVYATEFGVQSYPNTVAGVPLARQSDYRSIAEYIAYRNPRVVSFAQYLLTDPAPLPGSTLSRYVFQMGLYLFAGHRRKPVYDSFRTPLVVRRDGHGRVALWGLVRPARATGLAGRVTLQTLDQGGGAKWRTVLTVGYGRSGYWTARGTDRRGRRWRVRFTDAAGRTFTGPATAGYRF